MRELYITNKKETIQVVVKPVDISRGDVKVEVVSGLEHIYSELPLFFEVRSYVVVQHDTPPDRFSLVIERAEDDYSDTWFWDCVCFDVTLEPHELEWFN
nr:MAG TPA: hypothetical protein [Caudoviricetes sp.]